MVFEREYTFFSHCHRAHSRIDFFLIAKSLINSVVNCDIRSIAITDHAAVEVNIKAELEIGRGTSWRMNTTVLHEKSYRMALKEDLNFFF